MIGFSSDKHYQPWKFLSAHGHQANSLQSLLYHMYIKLYCLSPLYGHAQKLNSSTCMIHKIAYLVRMVLNPYRCSFVSGLCMHTDHIHTDMEGIHTLSTHLLQFTILIARLFHRFVFSLFSRTLYI